MKLGQISSIAAGAIDQIYAKNSKTWLANLWNGIQIRAWLAVFFVLNTVDLFTSLTLGLGYGLRSFFTSETVQERRLNTQGHYATLFGRSFYALLATPISLFFPKLVIFYFVPEKNHNKNIASGGGFHHAGNVDIQQPVDQDTLANLIKTALDEGRTIIPLGAGRSQGRQFIPNNHPSQKKPLIVDLQKMNAVEVCTHDTDEPYAWIEAGALWSDVQSEASKHGCAVKVMQASNIFSVGGSIGTNIHGWDYHTGMISNTIDEMLIINTRGELQRVTREDELFHHITGGMGLFGVVYKVKMKLAVNDKLERQSVNVAPSDYLQYFNDNLRHNNQAQLHLYRLSLDPKNLLSKGFTETYVKTDGKPVKEPHLSEPSQGTRIQRVLVNVARQFGWARRLWWEGERKTYLNEHPIQTRNQIMQAPIGAMFNNAVSEAEWLQEFFLPGEELDAFLKEFAQLLMQNDVTLLNASVRFVKQNADSPMSYAKNGDRFAVVICFNQLLQPEKLIQAQKWLRKAQELAVNKGGSYYLPYQEVSSPETFEASFPGAKAAQQYKETIDPTQQFTSGFHAKFMKPHPTTRHHVKEVLNSPDARKQFKGFLKNILKRLDSDKLYRLLDDIVTYKDTHEDIYRELCARLPEIMPSALSDIRHQFDALGAIKQDLGQQAQALLPPNLKTIHGILEVGSPGRFAQGFKQAYQVSGKIIAVNEGTPSLMHKVDAGALHPYDQYIQLDYNNTDLSSIPENSIEVATCYVGLHHFSPEQLDVFLTQVRRVLKKDGHFLLVDHDIMDETSLDMAHMAHFIFNAVNGVSVQEEINEIRDFQPLSNWKKKLAEHGLYIPDAPDVALIRNGDPTRNRMIAVVNSKVPACAMNAADEETMPTFVADTTCPSPSALPNHRREPSHCSVTSVSVFQPPRVGSPATLDNPTSTQQPSP